jgi:hypothetical protein
MGCQNKRVILKIVLGAFYSCGRRERRFEARVLRERIRLETLFAASELAITKIWPIIHIFIIAKAQYCAELWCPRVEAGLKMYKCALSEHFQR